MKKLLTLMLLLCSVVSTHAQQTYPGTPYQELRLVSVVTDDANILSEEMELELATAIRQVEAKTGAEVYLLTIPDLQGEDISVVSQQIFHNNGLGQKASDNGVLYLIAPNQRKQYISTGYGMESYLPDAICYRILHTTEPLMSVDMPGAIAARTGAILTVIQNHGAEIKDDETQSAKLMPSDSEESGGGYLFFYGLIIVILIIVTLLALIKRRNENREKIRNESIADYRKKIEERQTKRREEILSRSGLPLMPSPSITRSTSSTSTSSSSSSYTPYVAPIINTSSYDSGPSYDTSSYDSGYSDSSSGGDCGGGGSGDGW